MFASGYHGLPRLTFYPSALTETQRKGLTRAAHLAYIVVPVCSARKDLCQTDQATDDRRSKFRVTRVAVHAVLTFLNA